MRHAPGTASPLSRRDWLRQGFLGLGAIAAADLMARNASASTTLTKLHHRPAAKRIIYIFLEGGLSQLDSYDHKPALQKYAGQPLPASVRPPQFTFAKQGTVIPSPFDWRHWGESGTYASDLFPEVNGRFIDDLCFIHSLHHRSNDHVTAKRDAKYKYGPTNVNYGLLPPLEGVRKDHRKHRMAERARADFDVWLAAIAVRAA